MKIKILENREIKNAAWLIGGRIVQMALSLLVSVLTARYLGPSNYGLINYASAYVTFFTSLCTLGINSVIIKEFLTHPDQQGEALGTTLVLRAFSSLLSSVMIIGLVNIIDRGEPLTISVTALSCAALLFQTADSVNYWFQSRYQSRVTAIATLVAYIAMSVYKIILLALGKDVRWFAFAVALEHICTGVVLFCAYKKHGGPKLSFSWAKGKALFSSSYHYILSGMMIVIYGQTDTIMLKQMVDEAEVGYYSIAHSISSMWVFVLAALIDSMYPTIVSLHDTNTRLFERKNKQLYCMVFYLSMTVSLLITLLGGWAIRILYGPSYAGAEIPLKVITWYTAFSYLGVARNAWVVSENKQKYLKYISLIAVFLNIGLNWLLIPRFGAVGAAAASLLTEIGTSIAIPAMYREMRSNVRLILEAICMKDVF